MDEVVLARVRRVLAACRRTGGGHQLRVRRVTRRRTSTNRRSRCACRSRRRRSSTCARRSATRTAGCRPWPGRSRPRRVVQVGEVEDGERCRCRRSTRSGSRFRDAGDRVGARGAGGAAGDRGFAGSVTSTTTSSLPPPAVDVVDVVGRGLVEVDTDQREATGAVAALALPAVHRLVLELGARQPAVSAGWRGSLVSYTLTESRADITNSGSVRMKQPEIPAEPGFRRAARRCRWRPAAPACRRLPRRGPRGTARRAAGPCGRSGGGGAEDQRDDGERRPGTARGRGRRPGNEQMQSRGHAGRQRADVARVTLRRAACSRRASGAGSRAGRRRGRRSPTGGAGRAPPGR